jgi:hypothetical protein
MAEAAVFVIERVVKAREQLVRGSGGLGRIPGAKLTVAMIG